MLFDKEMRGPVEEIVVGGCPFFKDLEWRFTYLPIRSRGLRLYSVV